MIVALAAEVAGPNWMRVHAAGLTCAVVSAGAVGVVLAAVVAGRRRPEPPPPVVVVQPPRVEPVTQILPVVLERDLPGRRPDPYHWWNATDRPTQPRSPR